MAKEARKLRRASQRGQAARGQSASGKAKKKELSKPVVQQPAEMPDPLGKSQLKSLGLRLGLPIAALWMIGGFVACLSQSSTTKSIALGLPALVTAAAIGLVLWALRYARKAKGVHRILRQADSADARQDALDELDEDAVKAYTCEG